MTRVGVIDYGMGNRRSVEKALAHVGADPVLTGSPTRCATATAWSCPAWARSPRG